MTKNVDTLEARDLKNTLHGFSDLNTLHNKGPVIIDRGEGPYVYDIHGNKFLEANSGLWNVVAGFNHEGLAEAACQQIKKFPAYHSFFGRISQPTIELAEKLIEIAPVPMSKAFFTNSGSEANDSVIKLLWMINEGTGEPKRRKIISRVNAYHGTTVITTAMTGKAYAGAFGLPGNSEVVFADCPHFWRFAEEGETELDFTARMARQLEELIEREGAETIACFYAEPVMGAGGVIPPSEGYFQAIQPILKKHGIPLVADEVITGFGRTGNLWGTETLGMEPDVIVASKVMTAGYFPMGAVMINEDIYQKLMKASEVWEEIPHGFTTGGHPVGCAIALKAIDIVLNEGVFENVVEVGAYFQEKLKSYADHKYVGEARGVGLMGAIELVADKQTKAAFPSEYAVSEQIAVTALEHGLIVRPIGQAIVLCPPFIITRDQIDELFEKLDITLKQVFSKIDG
ncbi:aminotransferase [Amphritea sp. HPY]|uniref:aminotransferase n=1 Tax=Amphritea sp. HPY TaxID=3421652 RepID=UPI003D7C88FC